MMRRLILITATVLLACTVGYAAPAKEKKQVTRDVTIKGTTYAVITNVIPNTVNAELPPTIQFEVTGAVGVMSHAGKYDLKGFGELDLATGLGWDEGVFIAASGAEVWWTATISPNTQGVPQLLVTTTPGTGTDRWVGGYGWFLATVNDVQIDWTNMKMNFSYVGEGEITF